jgi:hypothetical protein
MSNPIVTSPNEEPIVYKLILFALSFQRMSEHCRRNVQTLRLLAVSNPSVIKRTLSTADDSLFKALREIVANVLKGPVQLTEKQKKFLAKRKKLLYSIADDEKRAERELKAKGHLFLATIIPPALEALRRLDG